MHIMLRVVWPSAGDETAALRALSIGMIFAVAGSLVVLFFSLRTLLSEGITFSGVGLPVVGSILLGVAAGRMYRRAPNSSGLALLVWIAIGVVAPISIPTWLTLVVLLPLVIAVRGSHVLGRLSQANG
jgi:hypothetical protein